MRARTPEGGKLERKEKLLRRILAQLDNSVVIVEGKKDAKALKQVGVKGTVLLASGRVKGICERIAAERAVILTDNDEAGKELAEILVGELEACNIRADLQVRRDLHYVLGLNTVEEMPRKMKEFGEKLRLKAK